MYTCLFDAVDLSIYRLYVKEKQLVGKVTPAWVRKKWENLKQKYKVMSCIHLGKARQGKFIYIAHFIHSGNSKCFT